MKQTILFQRLENLAILVILLWLYHYLGYNWWLVLGWFLVDLSMLGYLFGPKTGAWVYNLAHNYTGPVILALLGIHHPLLTALAIVWAYHVAVDRMLGFGLKDEAGFGHTHLGLIGR